MRQESGQPLSLESTSEMTPNRIAYVCGSPVHPTLAHGGRSGAFRHGSVACGAGLLRRRLPALGRGPLLAALQGLLRRLLLRLAAGVPVSQGPPRPDLDGVVHPVHGGRLLVEPESQPLDTSPGDHDPVVDAQPRGRALHLQPGLLRDLAQPSAHLLVGRHAARHHYGGHVGLQLQRPRRGAGRSLAEVPHGHGLEGRGDVGPLPSQVGLREAGRQVGGQRLLHEGPHRGLQAREGEVAARLQDGVARL
mmetsp:Transcript_79896/g.214702  ORF Transcript_79896/g.214702 Transcript_79896/m.214702 type:complete len:249 (-) Transcript_79896:1284-2030(-)